MHGETGSNPESDSESEPDDIPWPTARAQPLDAGYILVVSAVLLEFARRGVRKRLMS